MMNAIKMMEDKTLSFVTGGDNGDPNYEMHNEVVLYKEGEFVEVYKDPWHITTRRAKVESVQVALDFPVYLVRFDDNNCLDWVTSREIQRK